MKRKYIVSIIIIISIIPFLILGLNCNKKNINNATTYELQSVYGIGDKLAISIHDYVEKYDVDRVSELEGHIKYLGKDRIKDLKEVFK